MGKGIVLGRFQPFHNGHAYLVEQALARFEKVTIAVGSAQDEWTVDNPFSFEERKDMIQKWVDENGHKERSISLELKTSMTRQTGLNMHQITTVKEHS